MPRTRWIVIGGVLAVGIIGGALNARGPFAAHPSLAYPQFLADFQAGRVDQMAQWRDQLEVTEARSSCPSSCRPGRISPPTSAGRASPAASGSTGRRSLTHGLVHTRRGFRP